MGFYRPTPQSPRKAAYLKSSGRYGRGLPIELAVAVPFAVLMCALGCGPRAARDDMQFRVDPARLGARFAAPGVFEVKAPAGWEPLPDSMLSAAMARFDADPHAADAPALRAVYRQADGAALAVSQFPAQLGTAARTAMAESVTSALRARDPGARVEPSRFHYQGLEIAQVMFQDSTRVVFKLLVDRPGSPLYQLDYVVPLPVYRREVESLESSIGSLRTQS